MQMIKTTRFIRLLHNRLGLERLFNWRIAWQEEPLLIAVLEIKADKLVNNWLLVLRVAHQADRQRAICIKDIDTGDIPRNIGLL